MSATVPTLVKKQMVRMVESAPVGGTGFKPVLPADGSTFGTPPAAGVLPAARLVEQKGNIVVLEVTCLCGRKTYLECAGIRT